MRTPEEIKAEIKKLQSELAKAQGKDISEGRVKIKTYRSGRKFLTIANKYSQRYASIASSFSWSELFKEIHEIIQDLETFYKKYHDELCVDETEDKNEINIIEEECILECD